MTKESEEFERQANCVADAWLMLDSVLDWQKVLNTYELGFPYAWLVTYHHGTLNEEGKKMVTDTYDYLVEALGIPWAPYTGYVGMLQAYQDKA